MADPGQSARNKSALRPTIFGLILLGILTTTFLLGLAVADPSAAALVWAGLFAVALFGALWPLITVRSVGIEILGAPTDLVVGQVGSIRLQLSGRAAGLTLRCSGSPLLVADVVSPGEVSIPLEVSARGAYNSIRVDLGSDAPFGVALALRTRTLKLPRRLLVGPETIRQQAQVQDLLGPESINLPRGVAAQGESVRSVRPYVAGDAQHLVHWPSTARTGELVVRELEPPVATGLALILDLSAGSGSAGSDSADAQSAVEDAASRAAGIAEDALAQGARVLLCTCEAGKAVGSEVLGVLQLRRRLALATPGIPAAAPPGWAATKVLPRPTRTADGQTP
ncbi:MAG: DUF58 domain-containing protein [Actinomycetes bacterium]